MEGAIDIPGDEHATESACSAAHLTAGSQWTLTLFDFWRLQRACTEVRLHRREQRLIALLALQGERTRDYVSGVLWPESNDHHAAGNLRAAVWRTHRDAPGLLFNDRSRLRLTKPLQLDIEIFARCALRILGWRQDGRALDLATCLRSMPVLLHGDLLPGWYDDWVIYERARLMQIRLQALEVLADLLVDRGEVVLAQVAASAAVSIEPLHEPATRALVRAELEDSDYGGALRDYEAYRSRVLSELGVPPSDRLYMLIRPLLEGRSLHPGPARILHGARMADTPRVIHR